MAICSALAKPSVLAPAAVAYTSPLVAAPLPVVAAASSQVVARNYNGVAIAAAAPLVAAPAPFTYSSVFGAPYAVSPYAAAYSRYAAAPFGYAAQAPFGYAAQAPLFF